jgi:hypothetical protein
MAADATLALSPLPTLAIPVLEQQAATHQSLGVLDLPAPQHEPRPLEALEKHHYGAHRGRQAVAVWSRITTTGQWACVARNSLTEPSNIPVKAP